jgi:hypothetical protein
LIWGIFFLMGLMVFLGGGCGGDRLMWMGWWILTKEWGL